MAMRTMDDLPDFKGIRKSELTLNLIDENNRNDVVEFFKLIPDTHTIVREFYNSYIPRFNGDNRRTKWGFWIQHDDQPAGLCLLGINSWKHRRGYTGTDILPHMRGRGISPATKPLLFFLGFHQLGLNRIETGCFVSNISSQRAIEKTEGFQFEGILRAYALNSEGIYEDERRYAILRQDWERFYDISDIEILS